MNAFRPASGSQLGWRDLLLGAALFAALLRALIPVGFMPHAAKGSITMVICTIDGARTVSGQPLESSGAGDAMTSAQMPCAFAALAAMAPPPDAPVLSLAIAIERHLVTLDETAAMERDPPHRPQAQRAPPARVI